MAKGQIKQKQSKIDKELFEKMCHIQCTEVEICSILNICEDTLNSWCKNEYGMNFSETYKKYSAGGKMSLRRTMFKQAENNPTMAIWLSKQYLGMKDSIEEKHEFNNGVISELIGALKNDKED